MKKFLVLVVMLMTGITAVKAQSYTGDALVYSRPQLNGTPRSLGVAGAFSSVGADMSSFATNPAGIGLYRSSEISVSAGFNAGRSESNYLGSNTSKGATTGLFNHVGVVWTKGIKSKNAWGATSTNTISMGMGYSRLADFNNTRFFKGTNNSTSFGTSYTNLVNAVGANPEDPSNYSADVYMAYLGYLINYDTALGYYTSPIQLPVYQTGTIKTKGGLDEVNLTLAGNINDQWYLGVDLGIPILRYNTTFDYMEETTNDSSDFQNFSIRNQIGETGFGLNGKFGLIYRPTPWVRIGIAYHTPSFMAIGESYTSDMQTNFASFYSTPAITAQPFNYRFKMPMKGIAGASFYFKQYGFFTVDYEFLNYAANKFTFPNEYETYSNEVNATNKRTLAFGHNIKAGVEGAIKTIRLRAGYSFMSGSYKSSANIKPDDVRHNVTAGFGYRGKHLFVDVAYVYSLYKNNYEPYTDIDNLQPVAESRNNRHGIVIGVGYKFGNVERTAQ
jgi:hypothetical protein